MTFAWKSYIFILYLLSMKMEASYMFYRSGWMQRLATIAAFVGALGMVHAERAYAKPQAKQRSAASATDQVGTASIYHDKGLVVASNSFPIGTYVLIINLEDAAKRSVCARVKGTGPFARGRMIDLSEETAKAIGLTHDKGLTRVSVHKVDICP
jgi:rare lipoprotein A (peptidoglycan hydrolase)